LREQGIAVLHDRRIPGSRANIDHLVVSQAGVFVIDTKHYKGRVEQRDLGGWLKSDLRLYVGSRDRTKLVEGMKPQVEAVRRALAKRDGWRDEPVTAALLFMSDDNWSLLNLRPLRFGDVYVLWGTARGKLIRANRPGGSIHVREVERSAVGLRASFAPALGRRLRRVGQMRTMPGTLDLLDHEPPTGRALEREVHLIDAVELRKPLPYRLARGGSDKQPVCSLAPPASQAMGSGWKRKPAWLLESQPSRVGQRARSAGAAGGRAFGDSEIGEKESLSTVRTGRRTRLPRPARSSAVTGAVLRCGQ
jgi:hypothetical protein